MAINAARQTDARQGIESEDLSVFTKTLAASADVPSAFEALAGRGHDVGFSALVCWREPGEGRPPEQFHTLHIAAARLFADEVFRRAWPLERAARADVLPLCWTTAEWPGDRGAAAQAAMERLSKAGVEAGVSLAARAPGGRTLLLTGICSTSRLARLKAVDLDLWTAAAMRFLARVEDLTAGPVAQPALSRREAEILQLTAEGLTAIAAAERLGVSEATIKFHLAGARRRFGVKNTAGAVARFRDLG